MLFSVCDLVNVCRFVENRPLLEKSNSKKCLGSGFAGGYFSVVASYGYFLRLRIMNKEVDKQVEEMQ